MPDAVTDETPKVGLPDVDVQAAAPTQHNILQSIPGINQLLGIIVQSLFPSGLPQFKGAPPLLQSGGGSPTSVGGMFPPMLRMLQGDQPTYSELDKVPPMPTAQDRAMYDAYQKEIPPNVPAAGIMVPPREAPYYKIMQNKIYPPDKDI